MLGRLLRHASRKGIQGQRETFSRSFAAFGSSMPSPTKLEAIVNMDKMLERDADQVSALWQEVTYF